MGEHQVRRLPVCEEDGRLVGMLAQATSPAPATTAAPARPSKRSRASERRAGTTVRTRRSRRGLSS